MLTNQQTGIAGGEFLGGCGKSDTPFLARERLL
jgi:hypothetical protein